MVSGEFPVQLFVIPNLCSFTKQVQSVKPEDSGCLPFSQKIRKFWFEVKRKGNFSENLFGNCGKPPEIVHFFCSEWISGN